MFLIILPLLSSVFANDDTCGAGNSNLAKPKHSFINDYHFPMVADDTRNMLFYSALQKAIVPNASTVLDVGAGTMLLSMMSIQLGAAKVVGVEGDPIMSRVAKEVLRANNYTKLMKAGRIRLYEGAFESLNLGHKYLKQPADIMVSETFDAALIGEKFLSILTHAKSSGVLKSDATIIPNSAVIYGTLLESTLSLPRGANNTDWLASGMFNLEPMRKYRPAQVYTVRYLNEQNAVRQKLSETVPLFEYDFQNYDLSNKNFAYSCVVFEITEADEGVFDSIGLWFKLFLDNERELVVSNAPETPSEENDKAPCWMQAIYRVSRDVMVKRGDVVRIQLVQTAETYVIGEVGNGYFNQDSRLIKFVAIGCKKGVEVHSYLNDDYDEIDERESMEKEDDEENEYLVGIIAPTAADQPMWQAYPARVFQRFKLVTQLESGKYLGLWYQLPDSTASMGGTRESQARTKLPLDTYEIHCPP